MTKTQQFLQKLIADSGLPIVSALNRLTEAGLISDNVVRIEDIADADAEMVVACWDYLFGK